MPAPSFNGRIPAIPAVLLWICFALLSPTSQARDADGKIVIVASLFPQYDFCKQIGGDAVRVRLLLPPGVESHSYEPTPSDLVDIARADLFVFTGPAMEPWASRLASAIEKDSSVLIVDAAQGIALARVGEGDDDAVRVADSLGRAVSEHGEGPAGNTALNPPAADPADGNHAGELHAHAAEPLHLDEYDHDHGGLDPHIWLDPTLAAAMVGNISLALERVDPEHAGQYRSAAEKYRNELLHLDREFAEIVAASPRRELVFGERFAFGYFFRRYGLIEIGPYKSCAPGSEPGLQSVIAVVKEIKEKRIRCIYRETLAASRIAEILREETGAEILTVDSLHNPSVEQRAAGITYLAGMEGNMRSFALGLRNGSGQENGAGKRDRAGAEK